MSEVGYKKPPKHTQFGQPGGNPTGKTSKQRQMEIENAERATRIRAKLLEAVETLVEQGKDENAIMEFVEKDVLRLVKESEDRGLGTAVQSINHESPNGTMTPKRDLTEAEVLEEMKRRGLPIPENE